MTDYIMYEWIWPFLFKFLGWITGLMPSWLGDGFATISGMMGPLAKYLGYLVGLDVVGPIVIGAYCVRWSIRRVPFFGR